MKRRIILSIIDICILYIVYAATAAVAVMQGTMTFDAGALPMMIVLIPLLYLFVYTVLRINNTIWRYSNESDYVKIFLCTVVSGFMLSVYVNASEVITASLGFYVSSIVIGAVGITMSRFAYRIYLEETRKVREKDDLKRLLIVGAGEAGAMMVHEIINNSQLKLLPVGFVDDDPQKINRTIHDFKVLGSTTDISRVCEEYSVELIYIAIPKATNTVRSRIFGECEKTNCEVKILPFYTEIKESDKSDFINKVRDITPEELLGREPIKVADENIYNFVSGKTVVITGGGGSIGSELCRQIAAHSPKRLVIIDIYENNAYSIQQELISCYGCALELQVYIASVRDYDKIDYLLSVERPDILIHAAAHKHVPLMEVSPDEAVKNNVFGTYNTACAAMHNHVKRFILISTDKAVNPTNIMGATKRVCEMIIQYFGSISNDTTYAAVRFGNVFGSNGSAIQLFKEQIKNRQDVTVTDPEMVRYFMTIPEASQLVLTAGAMASGGEIFVLDMGSPVKIDDLARRMIRLAGLKEGKDINIRYIGLRPGEKLYEELLMSEEGLKKTPNQKIYIGSVIPINYDVLLQKLDKLKNTVSCAGVSAAEVEEVLMEIVPTFKRYLPSCEPECAKSDSEIQPEQKVLAS